MKNLPENELLSACLDGELTAAEQAEVEQLLARSPASRQLLEELRALSTKLQALPRYTLGEDLSQQVLRVAERRMLTEPSDEAEVCPAGGPATPGEVPPPARRWAGAVLRRVLNPRALVWSALAVAIAVMLTLVNRGQQQRPAHNEIAKAPAEADSRSKAPEIAKKPSIAHSLPHARPGDTSGPTSNRPGAGYRPKADTDRQVRRGVYPGERPGEDAGSDLAPTDVRTKVARGATVAGIIGPSPAPGAQPPSQEVQLKPRGSIAQIVGGSPPAQWDLLVQCTIRPEAHGERVFDRALADNHIVWDEARANTEVLTGNGAVVRGQPREPVARQRPEQRQATGPQGAVLAEKVDLVYVEASWAQVKAVVTALEARPDVVSLVSSPISKGGGPDLPQQPATNPAVGARPGPVAGFAQISRVPYPMGSYGGPVQSKEASGAAALGGLGARAPMSAQPAAPPLHREGGQHEAQDHAGLRAYARRVPLPAPGLDLSVQSPNWNADLARAVALALHSAEPQTSEWGTLRGAAEPSGQAPQRWLDKSEGPATQAEILAKSGSGGRPAQRPPQSAPAGPTAQAGPGPKPRGVLEEQSRQRRTEKTSADAPMVRALFVFRAAELTSGAAAAAEKPGPVVTAPGGQQASPPPAVRK